ncbi:peroxisome biogenesis factor 10 [Ooceraea biroi]|uniref:RING-type E3 ubiquitin transferase n=1 Tax=Ooceraea biroi TaxID=2015173 RepID=A0A026VTN1_OOCBI|nr:peroxisome biogenesis factor 10 [Ooceraea biroi]EZA47113.1 Peroxisome biogenesis factor [Ooceraea biroi]
MGTNNKWPRRKLRCASQAEILRAHQRDDDFVKDLRDKLAETLQNLSVRHALSRCIQSDIPFKLLYFVFTSGMGNQTLGEEYTGIVQADLEARRVPTLTVRVLAAILECLGERTLLGLLGQLQARVNHPQSELTPAAATFLNASLSKLRMMIPVIILLHKGLFYLYGRYYSLGRRIAGLDHAKVYGHRPVDTVSWGLKLLGVATLIQSLLKIWQTSNTQDVNTATVSSAQSIDHSCQMCFEARATTTTLCGHLFCWSCLSEWLRVKPQCPYCREHMPPSRIIHMMNL